MSIFPSTVLLKSVVAASVGGFIALGGVSAVSTGSTDSSNLAALQDDSKKKTGTVSGTVKDPDGELVAKVPVSLAVPNVMQGPAPSGADGLSMNAANQPMRGKDRFKVVAKTVSDADGKFKFAKPLEPQTYRVEAGRKGYAYTATSVTVKAGEEAKLDLKLRPGRNSKR